MLVIPVRVFFRGGIVVVFVVSAVVRNEDLEMSR